MGNKKALSYRDQKGATLIEVFIIIIIIIILFFFIRSIILKHSNKQQIDAGLEYQPPFIPLTISVNKSGKISLKVTGAKLPTPIGTFSLYANVSFPDQKILTVVVGEKKHMYDMKNTSFRVNIPNDKQGQSKIEYDGKGNITVVIPEPVWK